MAPACVDHWATGAGPDGVKIRRIHSHPWGMTNQSFAILLWTVVIIIPASIYQFGLCFRYGFWLGPTGFPCCFIAILHIMRPVSIELLFKIMNACTDGRYLFSCLISHHYRNKRRKRVRLWALKTVTCLLNFWKSKMIISNFMHGVSVALLWISTENAVKRTSFNATKQWNSANNVIFFLSLSIEISIPSDITLLLNSVYATD